MKYEILLEGVRLSDDSVVWNVYLTEDVVFHAIDKKHARTLAADLRKTIDRNTVE